MPKVTIQSGNTLTGIAKGTGYTPQQLAAYNSIEDPNKIRVGQDIFIPYSRQEFESFAGPMAQPAQATAPVQPVAPPPQPVVQTRQAQVVDPKAARNVRNNNPGNLKIESANKWNGRSANPSETTFETFKSPEYGARAFNIVVGKNLAATNNFEEFVNRYASEKSEKDYYIANGKLMPHLQNYANNLAKKLGLKDSVTSYPKGMDRMTLLKEIIRNEGNKDSLSYFTDDVLAKGIGMK